jgi:hypothetical protein
MTATNTETEKKQAIRTACLSLVHAQELVRLSTTQLKCALADAGYDPSGEYHIEDDGEVREVRR